MNTLRPLCAALLIGLIANLQLGCMSVVARHEPDLYPAVYPGTRVCVDTIGEAYQEKSEFAGLARFLALFYMADMPFSFALDTVLIPYDAVRVIAHTEENPSEDVGEPVAASVP